MSWRLGIMTVAGRSCWNWVRPKAAEQFNISWRTEMLKDDSY